MKYKMVVLDLDDTLLNKKQKISVQTVQTLNQLKDMGVEIVIATGRMFSSALKYVKQLDLAGMVITYNGAYIKDLEENKVIYHRPIELDLAKRIIKEAEAAELYINIYVDDQLYVSETNEKSQLYQQISQVEAKPVGKVSDFIHNAPTKMLIIEKDEEKVQHYLSYFKEKYAGLVEVTQSKSYFIEIMAKGVSKGIALENVAEKLNIPLVEVIAIGDNWNDLAMIKTAGLGIAMGNAPEGVKRQADKIAGDHDNEGVSNVLAEIFSV